MVAYAIHLLAQSADMTGVQVEAFFGLDQGQRFVLLIIATGCLTGIIMGLGGLIYKGCDAAHRRRLEDSLKRELIDRGMTADEVVKVIEATTPVKDSC